MGPSTTLPAALASLAAPQPTAAHQAWVVAASAAARAWQDGPTHGRVMSEDDRAFLYGLLVPNDQGDSRAARKILEPRVVTSLRVAAYQPPQVWRDLLRNEWHAPEEPRNDLAQWLGHAAVLSMMVPVPSPNEPKAAAHHVLSLRRIVLEMARAADLLVPTRDRVDIFALDLYPRTSVPQWFLRFPEGPLAACGPTGVLVDASLMFDRSLFSYAPSRSSTAVARAHAALSVLAQIGRGMRAALEQHPDRWVDLPLRLKAPHNCGATMAVVVLGAVWAAEQDSALAPEALDLVNLIAERWPARYDRTPEDERLSAVWPQARSRIERVLLAQALAPAAAAAPRCPPLVRTRSL